MENMVIQIDCWMPSNFSLLKQNVHYNAEKIRTHAQNINITHALYIPI